MKLYTKTGDAGTTGLIGGQRVRKDDLRIEAYGTVDELNACLGLAAAIAQGTLADRLLRVQGHLFVLGSHLATPTGAKQADTLPALPDPALLEREMDEADTELAALKTFILPGGTELASRLHLGRCVCRRAERACVSLAEDETVDPVVVVWLNRLSDWLFSQARLANHAAGVDDIPWTGS
ncbi:MAG: cob(I)yrinic acid a,c-diamide adenosyltransferase [Planctomycetota bacterium]